MRIIKRLSAFLIALLITVTACQDTFSYTKTKDIYNMLLKANRKNCDYKEVINSSYDAGGGNMSNESIYAYSQKSDLTRVEQSTPMTNGKVITMIKNSRDTSKRKIYIYNTNSKKYEKYSENQRYGMNSIDNDKFINVSDKTLMVIADSSKVTENKGSITIKSKLKKAQIDEIQKESQESNTQNRWGRGGMNRGFGSYDSMKYTIVLQNGKIVSAIVEQSRKSNQSNNIQRASNRTEYSITYESQSSIISEFKSKVSSKAYTGNDNMQGFRGNGGPNGGVRGDSRNGQGQNGKGQNGFAGFNGGFGGRGSWGGGQSTDSAGLIDTKIVLAIGSFIVLLALVYNYLIKDTPQRLGNILKNKWTYIGALLIILIARIFISARSTGLASDIRLFQQWATSASNSGLENFYTRTGFVDYPPGYMYVLFGIGKLYSIFNLGMDSQAALVLIKLPAVLSDMAIAVIVYMIARKRINEAGAFGLSMIFALNPSVILDSAIWGQVDSVSALFILISILLLSKKRMRISSVVFAAAILIKPQALIFSPLFIWAFIKERSIKEFLLSALSGIATLIILILPFSIKQNNPLWIIDLYKNTLSSYPYASVNGFNMFAFFGGNFSADTGTFLVFSYQAWSIVFIMLIVAFSGYMFFKYRTESHSDQERDKYFYIATFIIVAVFTLTSKMHERYMYPAMVFSLVSYIYSKNVKVLYIYAAASCTFFINVFYVMKGGGMAQITTSDLWLIFTAICNIVLLGSIIIMDLVKKPTKN